jgi:hypothetical protein
LFLILAGSFSISNNCKMSSNSDVLGYFVPNAMLSEIFSKLLSLKETCRFDTAICNYERRPLFLVLVKSESCIFLGDEDQYFNSDAISWLESRSILIRHLKYRPIMTDDIAIKIAGFGRFLDTLDVSESDCRRFTDTSVIRLAEGCPQLLDLNLSDCCFLTDAAIIRLSEGCPQLSDLNLSNCHNVSDTAIISLAEGCPQ